MIYPLYPCRSVANEVLAPAAISSAMTTTTAPVAPASAAPASAAASVTSTTAPAAVSASRPITLRPIAARNVRRAFAIEIGFAFRFVGKITAPLDHNRARGNRLTRWRRSGFPTASTAAHLRALLFQDRLARQPDAIAFHRQHF